MGRGDGTAKDGRNRVTLDALMSRENNLRAEEPQLVQSVGPDGEQIWSYINSEGELTDYCHSPAQVIEYPNGAVTHRHLLDGRVHREGGRPAIAHRDAAGQCGYIFAEDGKLSESVINFIHPEPAAGTIAASAVENSLEDLEAALLSDGPLNLKFRESGAPNVLAFDDGNPSYFEWRTADGGYQASGTPCGVVYGPSHVERIEFNRSESITGRDLPSTYCFRGASLDELVWADAPAEYRENPNMPIVGMNIDVHSGIPTVPVNTADGFELECVDLDERYQLFLDGSTDPVEIKIPDTAQYAAETVLSQCGVDKDWLHKYLVSDEGMN